MGAGHLTPSGVVGVMENKLASQAKKPGSADLTNREGKGVLGRADHRKHRAHSGNHSISGKWPDAHESDFH